MKKALKKTAWIIGYTLSALGAIALAAFIGITNSAERTISPAPAGLDATVVPLPAPRYDPSKPTVAILLSNTQTEASDFLMPYAMFAEDAASDRWRINPNHARAGRATVDRLTTSRKRQHGFSTTDRSWRTRPHTL